MNGTAVAWRTCQQKIVATSAATAEYIDVLGPLKEANLMVSKSKDAMEIGNVLGINHACKTLLEDSLKTFDDDDAIVEGIKFAIEKLNH